MALTLVLDMKVITFLLKLIATIAFPIVCKYLITHLYVFNSTFNLFILMFCICIVCIILCFIYISDVFTNIFLLEKQGSKLEYFKNLIIKKGE